MIYLLYAMIIQVTKIATNISKYVNYVTSCLKRTYLPHLETVHYLNKI